MPLSSVFYQASQAAVQLVWKISENSQENTCDGVTF